MIARLSRWRGLYVDAQPGAKVKVVAAELEFPGAKWSLAFKFEPGQEVAFNGTELKFGIGSWTNDNWQVGLCRTGELEVWRGTNDRISSRSRTVCGVHLHPVLRQ